LGKSQRNENHQNFHPCDQAKEIASCLRAKGPMANKIGNGLWNATHSQRESFDLLSGVPFYCKKKNKVLDK
jgi:hypothetical protein